MLRLTIASFAVALAAGIALFARHGQANLLLDIVFFVALAVFLIGLTALIAGRALHSLRPDLHAEPKPDPKRRRKTGPRNRPPAAGVGAVL